VSNKLCPRLRASCIIVTIGDPDPDGRQDLYEIYCVGGQVYVAVTSPEFPISQRASDPTRCDLK
jgi:hypothetical protein